MPLALFVCVSLISAFLGAALGVVLGRYVWPVTGSIDPAALATAQATAARLEQECASLRSQASRSADDYKAATAEARKAGEETARLFERVAALTLQIDEQGKQNSTLASQRDAAASEAKEISAEVARLKEREIFLAQKLEEQSVQLTNLQKQLTTEFENIATRILKASATELSESSSKTLAGILDPLRERIQDFQKKVEATYDAEAREVLSLKEQIKHIVETSTSIGTQADGLAKALRGDSQQLGRWGELALERILESAGLTEGREYVSQGRGMGLKNDAGATQKPDIVVMLPEQRTMIIDSKVPLASYERLFTARDEMERDVYADAFVREVKGHIEGLAGKRYQENEKLQAHDCVLMFVPIEGALAAALTRDPELFAYAWARNVVLVGPPTLLMTLRTVASIWRYELQGRNAQEIARLAGDLCDKVRMSLTDLGDAAEQLGTALHTHNEAIKRLATGKGNALSIGERIRALGVKTRAPMPTMLVDGVSVSAESDESAEIPDA